MPTHAAAHLSIETRMNTLWADAGVDVRYENEARKVPVGDHIRLFVKSNVALEMGFNANKILYRRPGIIIAQCFVQAKKGTQRARVIADAVLDIFEGKQFEGITCSVAEVVEVGGDKEGFWQANAKIFFDHDFERTY